MINNNLKIKMKMKIKQKSYTLYAIICFVFILPINIFAQNFDCKIAKVVIPMHKSNDWGLPEVFFTYCIENNSDTILKFQEISIAIDDTAFVKDKQFAFQQFYLSNFYFQLNNDTLLLKNELWLENKTDTIYSIAPRSKQLFECKISPIFIQYLYKTKYSDVFLKIQPFIEYLARNGKLFTKQKGKWHLIELQKGKTEIIFSSPMHIKHKGKTTEVW
jgi:hypothetical protein